MTRIMPMMEARKRLTVLPEELVTSHGVDVVEVTRRGKPVLAVLPWELYETVTETLEIMADNVLLAQLKQSVAELESGHGRPWEDARQVLLA
ncbi:MAG: type II toxin-antitoxin system Phd/YefM family antitoxin [Pseudomonadota bacterium]